MLGADIAVPTLDGTVKLRIPAGAENGQQLRVRGRGLPKGKAGERGDFFVVLHVQLPTAPSRDLERLIDLTAAGRAWPGQGGAGLT